MRYINLRFTFLLTLLTYCGQRECQKFTDGSDVVGGGRNDVSHNEQHYEESQQQRHTERGLVTGLRRQPVCLTVH